jgi:hypothetical protein
MPTITKIIRRWKLNEIHRFHVIGTGFDPRATVTMQDDRADWAAPTITSNSDTTDLVFSSHPTKVKRKVITSTASLTITVTNPDTSSASMDVDGSYES